MPTIAHMQACKTPGMKTLLSIKWTKTIFECDVFNTSIMTSIPSRNAAAGEMMAGNDENVKAGKKKPASIRSLHSLMVN